MLPRVAIIGRPNVGKSSLFNRLVGRRASIVEPTAGVTRDRVSEIVERGGRRFELIDTGGLGLVDEALLKEHVEAQIEVALHGSDLILFVVDGKEGRVPVDDWVADRLRRLGRKVLLVANKVESRSDEIDAANLLAMGFGDPLLVSAKEGFGSSDLADAVVAALPPRTDEESEPGEQPLRFSVVGKRNSGKSTLINRLAGEDRVIVSDVPGTTRDAVDVRFAWKGRPMIAIDTAGVRKKSSLQDAIELFSHARTNDGIRRADIVLHMFDVREEISQVDKALASYALAHHKPVLIVGNKVDLAPDIDLAKWDAYLRQQLAGLDRAPVAFLSAKDGTNLGPTMDLLLELREQARTRIPTPRLNQVLQEARDRLLPKGRGRFPKLFYGTQVGVSPITILVFVNEPKLFEGQYARFLRHVVGEAFGCEEVPIRFVFRRREKVVLNSRE
ncbi:MAG: ribosome biogenesis GTPase Der [Planctomycetota bacterium]